MPPRKNMTVSWKIYKGGKYIEVDPFTFVREHYDIPKNAFEKEGFYRIFGTGRIFSGSLGRSRVGTNAEKRLFVINFDLIESFYTQKTSKGGASTRPIFDEWKLGLRTLKQLLSPAELDKLAAEVYNDTKDGVLGLLQRYLSSKQAFQIHTREKQVESDFLQEHAHVDEDSGKIETPEPKVRWYSKKSGGTAYHDMWNSLLNDVVLGKAKKVGGGVISFGLQDLLGPAFQLQGRTSQFTSIFLMEEFGTGLNVDENLLRRYSKKGVSQSKWKVPSTLASKFGQAEATAMWFTNERDRYRAFSVYAQLLKSPKSRIKRLQAAFRQRKGATLEQAKEDALLFKQQYSSGTYRDKQGEDKGNPLYWAYGKKESGQKGRFGRLARNLFFEREGIVEEIRKINQEAYVLLFKLIDERVHAVVPNFPSIYNIVFRGAI